MRFTISEVVENDIEEISDYISQDSPQRAKFFVTELRQKIVKIAQNPFSYPSRPELGTGFRACTHGKYIIFFKLMDEEISIERILHGARDIEQLFDEERNYQEDH